MENLLEEKYYGGTYIHLIVQKIGEDDNEKYAIHIQDNQHFGWTRYFNSVDEARDFYRFVHKNCGKMIYQTIEHKEMKNDNRTIR